MASRAPISKSEHAINGTKKMEEQITTDTKQEAKMEEQKSTETKPTEVKEDKKVQSVKVVKVKKDYALVNGKDLPLSTKEGLHICDMIRYKNIDTAIKMVENVIVKKQVVEMRNREVGHKHGKGIMGARYPINASKEIVRLLKNLKATAVYNELDLEKVVLVFCMTNKASRPYKRGGTRMKRSHVTLKLGINPRQKNQKINTQIKEKK